MNGTELEKHYPGLSGKLARVSLTDLPTPLRPADSLGAELGLEGLLIKRDDLSGADYGGNKVRKLEYLLGEALQRECDTVVTFGAVGSNHILATAVYAARLGLQCIAVMTEQPVTPYVRHTLLYHELLGTRLELATGYNDVLAITERLTAAHPTGSERLFRIPWGGSSPLGTLGFVNAAFEIAGQCGGSPPDVIYVACGTMGTVAGLGLGMKLAGLVTRIEAIRVVPEPITTDLGIAKLFAETNRLLHDQDEHVPIAGASPDIRLRTEFYGDGYAATTPECLAATELMRTTEELAIETTYTGKALAALIRDARDGRLAGQRVIFWNTYNSRPYPPAVDKHDGSTLPAWTRRYLLSPD